VKYLRRFCVCFISQKNALLFQAVIQAHCRCGNDNICCGNLLPQVCVADSRKAAKVYFKVHSAVRIFDLENGEWFL